MRTSTSSNATSQANVSAERSDAAGETEEEILRENRQSDSTMGSVDHSQSVDASSFEEITEPPQETNNLTSNAAMASHPSTSASTSRMTDPNAVIAWKLSDLSSEQNESPKKPDAPAIDHTNSVSQEDHSATNSNPAGDHHNRIMEAKTRSYSRNSTASSLAAAAASTSATRASARSEASDFQSFHSDILDAKRRSSQRPGDSIRSPSLTASSPRISEIEEESAPLSLENEGLQEHSSEMMSASNAPSCLRLSTSSFRNQRYSNLRDPPNSQTTGVYCDSCGILHPLAPNDMVERHTAEIEEGTENTDFEEQIAEMVGTPGAFAVGLTRIQPRLKGVEQSGSCRLSSLGGSSHHDRSQPNTPPASPRHAQRRRPRLEAPQRRETAPGPEPQMISGRSARDVFLQEKQVKNRFWKHLWIGMAVLAGTLILVFVLRNVRSNKADPVETMEASPTDSPTVAPTASQGTAAPTSLERIQNFREILVSFSDHKALDTTGTPQFKALQWLANEDPAILNPQEKQGLLEIQDRYLVALVYFSLGIDQVEKDHSINDTFLSGDHVCDWKYPPSRNGGLSSRGIFCQEDNPSSRVVKEIHITGFKDSYDLNGSIPSEIGRFSSLQRLDLSQNGLKGSIPPEIRSCRNLQHLDLGLNSLSGSIPLSMEGLTQLTTMKMNNNNLIGKIPPEFASLASSLVALNLSNNALTGSIPDFLGDLLQLTSLDLSTNNFLGTIPASIGNLGLLEELKLTRAVLTGTLPAELGMLENVRVLELGENILDGTIPLELAGLESLQVLDLDFNLLKGDMSQFNTWVEMEEIKLRGNDVTGSLEFLCDLNPLIDACANCFKVTCPCCEQQGCCQ